MNKTETYHTAEEYARVGDESFLKHVSEYLTKGRMTPVCKVSSENSDEITFTFSNDFLEKINKNPDRIKKPYKAAVKYGLRGFSKGGKNGIFYQRKEDAGLEEMTNELYKKHFDEIANDIQLTGQNASQIKLVKIVYHQPSGERVVGLYNPESKRAIFLGFAKYGPNSDSNCF